MATRAVRVLGSPSRTWTAGLALLLVLTGAESRAAAQSTGPPEAFADLVLEAIGRRGAREILDARIVQEGKGTNFLAWGAEVSRRGVTRLDDSDLLRRANLLHVALTGVNESLCANWFAGRLTPRESLEFFAPLNADQLHAFADLVAAAVIAELKSQPNRHVATDDEYVDALVTVALSLQEDVANRLLDVLSTGNSAPDSDLCWSARLLYGAALKLDPAEQAGVIRAFATVETTVP